VSRCVVPSGTSIREHVKILVLYRRDIYQGHDDPMEKPPSKKIKFDGSSGTPTSSMKYLFGYVTEGMKGAMKMDEFFRLYLKKLTRKSG
jgi:hypothetical protein